MLGDCRDHCSNSLLFGSKWIPDFFSELANPIPSCAQEDNEGSRHIIMLTDGGMSHTWQFLLKKGSVVLSSCV